MSAVVRFPPIRLLSRGLIGLANLLLGPRARRIGVSESELLAMADVALEEDVIETHERELIHSIIEFGDTVVREVMVPRPDMRTLDADLSVSEALGVAMEAGFSRLPVHAGNVDDIVGRGPRQGPHPRRARRATETSRSRDYRPPRPLRPRDQAGGPSHARDAGAQVPPGHRGRRVRGNGRAW